jgi:hypothetical protein
MCGGHNLHLLFRSDQQSAGASANDGHTWWTGLVDMPGGHNLLLLFRSDQQPAGASKQGRACTHSVCGLGCLPAQRHREIAQPAN